MESIKIARKSDETNDQIFRILIPMKIRKKKGYVTMILPEGVEEFKEVEKPQNYNEKLVAAFVKAYKWQKMLRDEEVSNFTDITKLEKTGKAYVSKIFKLNYIAPDIVEAILTGNQPLELNLDDFTRKAIPDLWEEQREAFGF